MPVSTTGQMVAVVVTALICSVLASILVLGGAYDRMVSGIKQGAIVQRTVTLVDLLNSSPPELHSSIVKAANSRNERIRVDRSSLVKKHTTSAAEKRLKETLESKLGEAYQGRVQVVLKRRDNKKPHPNKHESRDRDQPPRHFKNWRKPSLDILKIAVQLDSGLWLNMMSEALKPARLLVGQTLLFLAVSLVFVILAVVLMLRRITRPLKQLAVAANDIGRGEQVSQLKVTGAEDVQDTIRAFNVMNERMQKFIADRTRTLAALSHDLRTPLTSMRLRIELLPDSPDKDQLLSTLEEMQQMSEATLSFLREASDKEESRRVDLNALLSSLCDDMTDLGLAVSYEETSDLVVQCRLISLKRALRNLIENGVKYGDQVNVSMDKKQSSVSIQIQDHGPGIPESRMEQMFEPFTRMEASRNRDSGGIGLGLAIARNNVRSHGGDVYMKNNDTGLLITIELPLE
ncbi:hypothetical protein EOPP23_07110 [Endozoicomonas sp. OPT23]|nr:hypothetical protein [Endozoicomonas sp. OPT23]